MAEVKPSGSDHLFAATTIDRPGVALLLLITATIASPRTRARIAALPALPTVDPDGLWLKLRALAEGAELANKSLFG